MRYQLFSDDCGSFLIVDTVRDWIIAKTTTPELGARICQRLNKQDLKELSLAKIH